MMKKTFVIAALCSLCLLVSSCNKQNAPAGGGVSFAIDNDELLTDISKSRVSDFTGLPAAADFGIVIKNSSSEVVWSGLLGSWQTTTPLAAGSYSVEASYGGAEGFLKPAFNGSADFSINGGDLSKVTIPVKLSNCIVKPVFTEAFKNYFSSCEFTLVTGAGSSFTFGKDKTDPVFIEPFKFTLSGTLTSQQGGTPVNFGPKEYEALKAATCYSLVFDAGNVGGLRLLISFDDSVQTVDLGEIEL